MKNIEDIRNYCLNCINKPCSKMGCPLGNSIPDFIHEKDAYEAFKILSKTTVLPAICGRICPHSKQCQGSCIRGIKSEPVQIGEAEAFIGDISLKENYKIPKEDISELIECKNTEKTEGGKEIVGNTKQRLLSNSDYQDSLQSASHAPKVAVIGSGPCGLTCAGFLARYGAEVTIFEKYNKLGGLLRHGIPDFRLDRKIVEQTIEKILELGIKVETGKELGKNISIKDLQERYDYVFVSIGANISNETLKGENVIKGNEFLERLNVLKEQEDEKTLGENTKNEMSQCPPFYGDFKEKSIAISGGGNVAMDCARTIIRMGADVTVIYRRDEGQMPAERYEIEMAKEEGVKFWVKTNIKSFDSKSRKLKCVKTELVKKDDDDRLSPVDIEGSDFELDFDYVVLATGAKAETELLKNEGLELNKWGYIQVNDKYQTSMKNVYAGGDVSGAKATVAFAAKTGREAAYSILRDYYTK